MVQGAPTGLQSLDALRNEAVKKLGEDSCLSELLKIPCNLPHPCEMQPHLIETAVARNRSL